MGIITSLGDPTVVAVSKDCVDNANFDVGDPVPVWEEQHFVLKDLQGEPVGLFCGPIDASVSKTHFTLYARGSKIPMQPLDSELLHPMEFDTQANFETLPILEVWHYVTGGILLKFPE